MADAPHPARKLIEAGSLILDDEESMTPHKHEIELSKAISLKRIADALDPNMTGMNVAYFLEQIALGASRS